MSQGVVDLFNQLAQNDFGFFQRVRSVADLMTREVKTLTLDDTYRDAIEFFRKNAFHHAPVIDPEQGDVVGIVSDGDILRFRPPRLGSAAEPEKDNPVLGTPVTQFMTRKIIALPADASPEAALTQMVDHHIDSVLIHDDRQRLEGILTVRDFMKMVLLFHRVCTSTPDLVRLRLVDLDMSRGLPLDFVFSRGARSVRDVMTREVRCVGEQDRVGYAIELMKSIQARHLPVVNETRQVVGLLTDRDILRSLPVPTEEFARNQKSGFRERLFDTGDEKALHERVNMIMNSTPATVRPDALFIDAITAMLDRDLSAYPVLDNADDRLCGIFTTTDVLRVLRVAFQIGSMVERR